MHFADIGYVVVMALWSALVVLLSYRLGYGNGERKAWEEVSRCREEGEKQKCGRDSR